MQNVYIDTSVFEANNFLEGAKIKELLRLGNAEHIQIILPQITHREVFIRAEKNLRKAIGRFKNTRDDFKTLRNIDSLLPKFEYIKIDEPFRDRIIREFNEKLAQELKNAKIVVIDYPKDNIEAVFEKYFSEKPPFKNKNKKNEFPDAFALHTIEMWCNANNQTCTVLSNDTDILDYESEYLIIESNYSEYLNRTLQEFDKTKRIQMALQLAQENKLDIEEQIRKWLYYELEDERLYYYEVNGLDIHDVDIKDCEAEIEEFNCISITKQKIEIEAEVILQYSVDLEIDDEAFVHYDDDDRTFHYYGTTNVNFNGAPTITVLLKVETPIAGEEFSEIEIEEYNNGKSIVLGD